MKVGFYTLGCKVNIYESNAIKDVFSASGFDVVEPTSECDVFVINTCSVTNMADAKSRKIINRAIALNEKAVIAVMGCYTQTNPEALEIPGVDVIVGSANKTIILDLVKKALVKKEKIINISDVMDNPKFEDMKVTEYDHTRAFIKIQDGCDNFCSYCIIPYARGPIRSKKAIDVITELKEISKLGYKEIVLSGIHTGKYNDDGIKLSELIKMILDEIKEIEVLRLSSIEINEIDDKMLALMKSNNILANYFHLPLQSGSDPILKLMNRRYDTNFYKERIKAIRNIRPDISITTDVIVGFPNETDELFKETYDFIEEINFSKLHVFPFSKRSKTKAYEMANQVNDTIKKNRVLELIELSNKLELNYAKKFIGKVLNVIIEEKTKDNLMSGHTDNYLFVYTDFNPLFLHKRVPVTIDKIENGRIIGHICL